MPWLPLKSLAPLEGEIPLSPRPLRRWLKSLPWLVTGETARLLYRGLLTLNQKPLPPGQRVQMMELMRDSTQPVLKHLSAQLADRSLPLSPRGQKILRLHLRLHKEIATGFRLALIDASPEGLLSRKHLAIATHRALRHMNMIYLQTAQFYETEPTGMWQEIHWLYGFAEEHRLTTSLVNDAYHPRIRQSTITDIYLQTLLLALAIPSTLRAGEAERLSQFFESNTVFTSIEPHPAVDRNQGSYLINLNLDRPPAYTTETSTSLASLRGMALDPLLTHLRERVQGSATSSDTSPPGNELPPEVARELLLKLTSHPKRDFARSERIEHIFVAIGLVPIQRAIVVDNESIGYPGRAASSIWGQSGTVPAQDNQPELRSPKSNVVVRNDFDPDATYDDVWGLLEDPLPWEQGASLSGLGNPGEDHVKFKGLEHDPPMEWSEWRLHNSSPGGFCINWNQDGAARAHVGEVIALREREGYNSIWRIGIIRWLRNITDQGLFAGIQLIADESHLVTVHQTRTAQNANTTAVEGLLLREIKALHQPASLILPAADFQTGDEIYLGANANRVRLAERLQYSGSFSQFLMSPVNA